MDLLDGKAMSLGLRLRHNPEHFPGQLAHLLLFLHPVDNLINIIQIPVNVGMMVPAFVGMFFVMMMLFTVAMFLPMMMLFPMMMSVLLQMNVKIIGVNAALLRSSKMQMVSVHMKALQRLF